MGMDFTALQSGIHSQKTRIIIIINAEGMKISNYNNRLLRAIIMILMIAGWGCAYLHADSNIDILKRQYTNKHPLVIVGNWDFAPYEFLNDKGEPSGFNIDVTNAILNKIGIPHIFVLKDLQYSAKLMNQKKADLCVGLGDRTDTPQLCVSKIPIYSFQMAIAYRQDTKPIKHISQATVLHPVMFSSHDYSLTEAKRFGLKNHAYHLFQSGKHALEDLQNGKATYLVWGKNQLKWTIREYAFKNIKVSEIDISGKEMRYMGHDTLLINVMEDQLERMSQTEELHQIAIKWFDPELEGDNNIPAYVTIVVLALIIVTLIIIFMDRKMKKNMAFVTRESEIINSRIKHSLENTDIYVICMTPKDNMVQNIYRNLVPQGGISEEEYIQRCHPDDRQRFTEVSVPLKNGKIKKVTIEYRWNRGTDDSPVWCTLHDQAMAECDANGKVITVICSITDITADQQHRRENQRLSNEYRQIFEHTITGIAFYDAEGHFLDANSSLYKACSGTYEGKLLLSTTNLFQIQAIRNSLEYQNLDEDLLICTNTRLPGQDKSIYQELCVRPIRDEVGDLIYFFLSVRNITEERHTFMLRRQEEKHLRQANEQIIQREEEIKFLFEKGDIRSWGGDFVNRTVTVYKTPNEPYLSFTFEDYINKIREFQPSFDLEGFILKLKEEGTYNVVRKIRGLITDDDEIHYYIITVLPELDGQGNMTGFFGLAHDITSLRNAEEELQQETERANDSGHQKSVFIANMSHEIRTPLNAIVGFSDLLQTIESKEDRKEFIHIIRNNSDMLLRLINDILTSSSIDSSELKMEEEKVNFSRNFDELCVQLAQRVTNPQVEFIKDNPYGELNTILDQARINQVITNFVTNAVKYTHQGHIKVGYRQQDNGLYIYCEDTGAGIPKEQCEKVFERFVKLNDYVQGTGLGLAICKSIAEKCGGKIGVDSEIGQGSTFWIWIPLFPVTSS
jgi:PAS domain S-box-containing protein